MKSEPRRLARGPVDGPLFRPDLPAKKADLHLHSNFSYDVLNVPELSPRSLYHKAVGKGMDLFTLTDHETMRGIQALHRQLEAEYGSELPIPLINGIEMKVRDPRIGHAIHINVLDLDRQQMLELARRRRSIDRFLEFCRCEDLYHSYNHPFWFERGERASLATVIELIGLFPVIELNAGRIPQLNGRTLEIARRFDKQVIATSDSHTGRVAKGYTMAPGETPREFLRNILVGNVRAMPHNTSLKEFMEEVHETIDLVFLRQAAFRTKPTFLRQYRIARRLAHATLRSEFVMRPWALKRVVGKAMQLAAYPPAYAFILQQKKMHWELGEAKI